MKKKAKLTSSQRDKWREALVAATSDMLLLLLLASTSVCAAEPTVNEVSAEELKAETSKHEVCSCLPFRARALWLLSLLMLLGVLPLSVCSCSSTTTVPGAIEW